MIRKLLLTVMAVGLIASSVHVMAKPRSVKSSRPLAASAKVLVNINKADSKALEAIKGIGVKKAKAIIAYRNSHGQFRSLNDLVKVRGIGVKRLAKLKPYLTV